MQTSDVPPSRKSMLASGEVNPSGPHHCMTYSGSDQAFHTCSTEASKTQVTTRSSLFVVCVECSLLISFLGLWSAAQKQYSTSDQKKLLRSCSPTNKAHMESICAGWFCQISRPNETPLISAWHASLFPFFAQPD